MDNCDPRDARETRLVLIPSYNSGAKLFETVTDALRHWRPVWVVIDGSTDGSSEALSALRHEAHGLRVICRKRNGGKGAAVLDGLRAANLEGYTHVLVMDSDGQHPASAIPEFMGLSRLHPTAMILGVPVFDRSAPWLRIVGRQLSNVFAKLETLGAIGDSLFGYRIYPIPALLATLEASRRMRGFDFDAEAAVRLSWLGVPAINQKARVRYFQAAEGGVSHYRYGRDNALLVAMHARLVLGFLLRLPRIAIRRLTSCGR